jgi:hypothetical protein
MEITIMSILASALRPYLPIASYIYDKIANHTPFYEYQAPIGPIAPPAHTTVAASAIEAPIKPHNSYFGGKVANLANRIRESSTIFSRSSEFNRTNIEMLVIPGGSSVTAGVIALSWLKANPHREVLFIVRKKEDIHNIEELKGRVQWLVMPDEGYLDKATLYESLDFAFKDLDIAKIAMVSCIGKATLSGKETFTDINVSPLINTSRAILKYASRTGVKDISLINISSIAASLIDPDKCAYVKSRVKSDEGLLALAMAKKKKPKNEALVVKAVSMRPGMIKSAVDTKGDFCPWDMEQFANMPFLIVPGSGEQEIPILDVDDLVDAILNCTDSKEDLFEIIDAIGQERVTYNQIMAMYLNRLNKKLLNVYIPSGLMQQVSNTIPYGKIAPYSGLLFEVMDHKDAPVLSHKRFEEVLRRPTKSLEEIYPKGREYVFHFPPVKDHILDAFEKAKLKPEIALALALSMARSAPYLVGRTLSGQAPAKKPGRSPFAIKPETAK